MIELVGRFHPLLVHLPIGILLLAILFEWISSIERYRKVKKSIPLIAQAGTFFAILSCVSGYALSKSGNYESNAIQWHQWMAITLTVYSIAYTWLLKQKGIKPYRKVFSIILLMLIAVTGHLGGTLTHGENYLLDFSEPDDQLQVSSVDLNNAKIYPDLIQPILQKKCYTCHSEAKQKGKLRLDSPEWITKGGESGIVLLAGKPDESEMINRIYLPRDNEDHMPPRQKPQLTETEIQVLKLWIASGADFQKSVSESGQLEAWRKIISNQEVKPFSDIPTKSVAAAPNNVIIELRKSGAVVLPVSAESNYLSVNLINVDSLNKVITGLEALRDQLIWLKAGNKNIADNHLMQIASLKNLTKLSLDNTSITDQGLSALTSLQQLQHLNIFNTKITAQGLIALKSLNSLRTVVVYQTAIKSQEKELVIKSFPNATVEFGNYEVPTLASDTSVVTEPINRK